MKKNSNLYKLEDYLEKKPKLVRAFSWTVTKLGHIVGFFVGCSDRSKKPANPSSNPILLERLEQKYYTYLDLYKSQQDAEGFIMSDHCDALLFTGLLGSVLPNDINITAARTPIGAWTRRPLVDGVDTCYPDNSKSSISRDMLLGLSWYMWSNERLDLASDLWDYGTVHSWIMGQGAPTRIIFTPNAQGDLAELIYRLGGHDHYITRAIPQAVSSSNKGFTAHLDMLKILLRAEMLGVLEFPDQVKAQYQREPRNALFSFIYHRYTDGNYDESMHTLLDEQLFPRYRLPTNADRKTPWLWERDTGSDWDPQIGDVRTHSGGDFLFMAHKILKASGRL